MKKSLLLLVLLGAMSSVAYADQVVSNCTSPTADANPVFAGSLLSNCGPGFQTTVNGSTGASLPSGATFTSIRLLSRYSISLELGGNTGSADFRHATNVTGLLGYNDFDNTGYDLVNAPFLDRQWGGGADISGGFFDCTANQAACAAIVSALDSGVVNIQADFQNAGGNASGVSVDFAWVIDFKSVPEPTSLMLLGVGVFAIEIGRRLARR